MARELTNSEKQILMSHPPFKDRLHWGVRNYASYWSTHSGAGENITTEAHRIKWAKDRISAVQIEMYDVNDHDIGLKFCKLMKGTTFNLPAEVQTDPEVLSAGISDGNIDAFAAYYFDLLGENINFSKSGN
jgi:hypothetical protein